MAKNHVQPGKIIDVRLSATVASGDLIQVGDFAAVALKSGVSGDTIPSQTDEVFTVPKLASDDMSTVGTTVYLDAANKRVTLTSNSGANIKAGKTVSAAAGSVATVNLKLNA